MAKEKNFFEGVEIRKAIFISLSVTLFLLGIEGIRKSFEWAIDGYFLEISGYTWGWFIATIIVSISLYCLYTSLKDDLGSK